MILIRIYWNYGSVAHSFCKVQWKTLHFFGSELCDLKTICLQFSLMRWGKWEDRKPQLANEIHPKGIGVGHTSQQGSQEVEVRVLLFNVHLCDVRLHYSKTTASANVWICAFHLITVIQIISLSETGKVTLSHQKTVLGQCFSMEEFEWKYLIAFNGKIMND